MVDTRPTMDEVLLDVAATMARRGTCSRQQNGAIVAREGRVLSSGYNGAPRGMAHCLHPPDEVTDGCTYAIHAEANAVAFAARFGVMLDSATMYVTSSPCERCAQLIVNAGIGQVVAARPYRLLVGVELLRSAGVGVLFFDRATRTLDVEP